MNLFKLISSRPYIDIDGLHSNFIGRSATNKHFRSTGDTSPTKHFNENTQNVNLTTGGIPVTQDANVLPGRINTFQVLLKPLITKYINDHTPHLKEFVCLLQQGYNHHNLNETTKNKPKIFDGQELVTINLGKCMHGSHNVQNHWHIPYIDEVNVSISITSSVLLTWLQMVIFILTPIFQLSGMEILSMSSNEFELFLNGFMDAFSNIMNSEIERLCNAGTKNEDAEQGDNSKIYEHDNESVYKSQNTTNIDNNEKKQMHGDITNNHIHETNDSYPLTNIFNEHLDMLKHELIDNVNLRSTNTTETDKIPANVNKNKTTNIKNEYWQTGDMLKNFGKQVCENIEHLRQINKFYVKYGKPEESNEFHKEITRIYINFLRTKYFTLNDFGVLAEMLFSKFLMYQSSVSILTSLIFSMFQTMLLLLSDEVNITIATPTKNIRHQQINTTDDTTNNNENIAREKGANDNDANDVIFCNMKSPIPENYSSESVSADNINNMNTGTLVSSNYQNITPMDVIANIIGTRLKMYLLAPTDQAWVNFLYELVINLPNTKIAKTPVKTTTDKMYSIVHRIYKTFQNDFKILDINHVVVLLPAKTTDTEIRRKCIERKTERAQKLFESDQKNGKLSMINQKIFLKYVKNLPESEYEMIFHMALTTSYFAFYNRFDMHLLQWTQKFTNMLLVSNTNKQDSLTFNNINKTFKSIAADLVLTRYIDYCSFSDLLLNNKNIKVLMDLVIHICKYSGKDDTPTNPMETNVSSANSTTKTTADVLSSATPISTADNINAYHISEEDNSEDTLDLTATINYITDCVARENETPSRAHNSNDHRNSYIVKKISGGVSHNKKGMMRMRKGKN